MKNETIRKIMQNFEQHSPRLAQQGDTQAACRQHGMVVRQRTYAG